MRAYDMTHLSDAVLDHEMNTGNDDENTALAVRLAHMAEYDERRLYAPAGFDSMKSYCVHHLHQSDDEALKRIRVARAGRKHPAVFVALAHGQIHLTAARMLAPHLTAENVDQLIAEATHRTKAEIELLLARRFPRSESLPLIEVITTSMADGEPFVAADVKDCAAEVVPGPLAPAPRSQIAPIAPRRVTMTFNVDEPTYDLFREAQELLSHQLPSGDPAQVLSEMLSDYVPRLRKQKFAATSKPRNCRSRSSANPRYISAPVKRAVWERDGAQCTFVSESGQHCPARERIEFDHVVPVARGGQATVGGIRLRCRTHNQYEAERVFGADFMKVKREDTRRAIPKPDDAVFGCLRRLGFHASEARPAAEFSATCADLTIEGRVRAALSFLRPNVRRHSPSGVSSVMQT